MDAKGWGSNSALWKMLVCLHIIEDSGVATVSGSQGTFPHLSAWIFRKQKTNPNLGRNLEQIWKIANVYM